MKPLTKQTFVIIFSVIVLSELQFMSLEKPLFNVHYFTKPLIVLSLILYFIFSGKHLSRNILKLTLLALLFSVIGDILLMFTKVSPHFFTAGLVAFLTAHIMYIATFLKKRNKRFTPFGIITLILIYCASIFYLLKDGLGNMLIPVVIYMLIISTMAITAFWRKGNVSKISFYLVFLGALSFVLSDSLLALNKFHLPFKLADFSIIITYALAQLLIVLGILKQK